MDSLPAEPPGKPKNTGVGSLSLLQGIFLTQGSNPGLPHYGQILYQLSHQGNPRTQDCIAYVFFPAQELNWDLLDLQADSLPTELSGKPKKEASVVMKEHEESCGVETIQHLG